MLVVKDAMVLIHLAKLGLLPSSCAYFGSVSIPEAVFHETVEAGKQNGFPDAKIIEEHITRKKIKVEKIIQKELIQKANDYNISGGEAEAVALYWQEKANLLATDDDNVRSKKELLDLSLIGTPTIIIALTRQRFITAEKATESIAALKKSGWFHAEVFDYMQKEVSKHE